MAEELLEVALTTSCTQEIEISAEGDPIQSVALGATTLDSIDENLTPDAVALFASAASAGLLGGDGVDPSLSNAAVTDTAQDTGLKRIAWRLRIENVSFSALRVLINMLMSQRFSRIQAVSVEQSGRVVNTEALLALSYPAAFQPVPFPVDYEAPLKRSKDRLTRIIFCAPPGKDVVESAYRAMELWTYVIMMGGYARDDQHPSQSGAMPDFAFLLDEVTIEQAFPEVFSL
jgi:hypothetical protein